MVHNLDTILPQPQTTPASPPVWQKKGKQIEARKKALPATSELPFQHLTIENCGLIAIDNNCQQLQAPHSLEHLIG
jgi:hypothetical protein